MHRAHQRDAIHTQRFFFRKNLFDPKPGRPCDPPFDDAPAPSSPAHDSASSANAHAPADGQATTSNGVLHAPQGVAPPLPLARERKESGAASSSNGSVPPSPRTCCSSHAPSRATSPDPSRRGTSTRAPEEEAPEPAFGPVEDEYDEFTLNEVVNGSEARGFPGLIGVVRLYLDGLEKEGKVSDEVKRGIERSLELVRRRADGTCSRSLS